MKSESHIVLPIEPPGFLEDKIVLDQIPAVIKDQLGELEGSGFGLEQGGRDLFYENGSARYWEGQPELHIWIE